MNKMAAELTMHALAMIELENYLKKMKLKEEHKETIEKVIEYFQYEIIRNMKDLVVTERL